MMKHRWIAGIAPMSLAALLGLWLACSGRVDKPAANPDSSKTAGEEVIDYKLEGIVRRVNKSEGKVAIDHKEIIGFMDAMLMTFPVSDPALLDGVEPGDEIEGTLRVVRRKGEVGDYSLTRLDVTVPAPAPTLELKLSGAKPTLEASKRPLEPGEEAPDFVMTTQDGKSLQLSDLRGKVVVLTFIYTRCPLPDYCPLVDRKFHDLAQKLEVRSATREGVRLLSISFDPEHDDPKTLESHARRMGAKEPLWTFAVATHEELRKAAESFGLMYGPMEKQIVHNLSIAILDQQGRLVSLDFGAAGKAWKVEDAMKTIAKLVPPSRK